MKNNSKKKWWSFLFIGVMLIYSILSPGIASAARSINAAFLQPSNITLSYTSEQFQDEFTRMKDIGIDTIIIQRAAFDDKAYYPSKYLNPIKPEWIQNMLKNAEDLGMGVYIGLPQPKNWFVAAKTKEFYDNLYSQTIQYAAELFSLYGQNRAVKGWYIPFEFSVDMIGDRQLSQFISSLSRELKRITKGQKIILSPYLGKRKTSLTPGLTSQWVTQWSIFLSKISVDIIAIQDSVGASGNDPSTAAEYLRIISRAFTNQPTSLWATVESFGKGYVSAPYNRLVEQINSEGPYVSGLAVFDFSHYMNPERGENASSLYKSMKKINR